MSTETPEGLSEAVAGAIEDHDLATCEDYSNARMWVACVAEEVNLHAVRGAVRQKVAAEAREIQEARELAEFERLSRKFAVRE